MAGVTKKKPRTTKFEKSSGGGTERGKESIYRSTNTTCPGPSKTNDFRGSDETQGEAVIIQHKLFLTCCHYPIKTRTC